MTERATTSPARRPGRPRKYGKGRIHASVRFTPDQYEALKKAADSQRRSISEEVEFRIYQSFETDKVINMVLVGAFFGTGTYKAEKKQ